jgi:hypothetical protein
MKKRDKFGDFRIPNGINLNKALTIARWLRCSVAKIRRTGEIRVSHPRMKKPCKVNARKKHAVMWLTCWLRRLHEILRKDVA